MMDKIIPYIKVFVLLIFSITVVGIKAQDEVRADLYKIKTVNGIEIEGTKIAEDELSITILTTFGEVKLNRSEIKSIKKLENYSLKDGEVWSENLQATRYFWQPNGYGLKKGEGYYQNIWVFFNQASYGITDKFSISAGLVPVFLFGGGLEYTPVWVVPKFSLPIIDDKVSVGIGTLIGSMPGEMQAGVFGIGFGTVTWGARDKNVTFGFGIPFVGDEVSSTMLITLNGMYRVSKKNYLVVETMFFEEGGMSVVGGRTVWPNIALDYGLMVPLVLDAEMVIPWVGFTIPF